MKYANFPFCVLFFHMYVVSVIPHGLQTMAGFLLYKNVGKVPPILDDNFLFVFKHSAAQTSLQVSSS